MPCNYPPFARYLFYCVFFFFLFAFLSTISRQPAPAGRFMPNFACRRTLVPLSGVSGPRGQKKGEMSNANGGFVSVLLTHLFVNILLVAYQHSWNICPVKTRSTRPYTTFLFHYSWQHLEKLLDRIVIPKQDKKKVKLICASTEV